MSVAGERQGQSTAPAAGAVPWTQYAARRRYLFLAVLFLVSTCSYIDKQIIFVMMEPLKAEFQLSDARLGVLTGLAFALLYSVMSFPIARWSDRGDRVRIVTVALALWSAMTVACGMARGFFSLLTARLGVGAAEAGLIPPAQSLLADYFPPQQRGTAIGIFMLSSTVGGVLALAVGGWLVEHFGWRTALVIAGVPGLPLAFVVYFVLHEPRRERVRGSRSEAGESLSQALGALRSKPTYLYGLFAKVIYFLVAYGPVGFIVSFMVRCHGLSLSRAGALYGTVTAIAGLGSYLIGGILADKLLASRGERWLCRLPGWALILALPFYLCAVLTRDIHVMTGALLLGSFLLNGSSPGMFSAMHLVCGSERRAFAVAIVFCCSNLLGLGLGPVLTGALSDALGTSLGPAEGLRTAMALVLLVLLPAGFCMFKAAGHIGADKEA